MSEVTVNNNCPAATEGRRTIFEPAPPLNLKLALNSALGPQRLNDDTVIIDENGWYRMLTPSSPWPSANEILFSNLDMSRSDAEVEAEIDAMIAEYHGRGLPLMWCVFPWTEPGNLVERLVARGATTSAIHVTIATSSLPISVAEDTEILEIRRGAPDGQAMFEDYIRILTESYPLPESEIAFRRRRYWQLIGEEPQVLRIFLALYQGEVAGCASMVVKEHSAHFTGDAILPAFRSRGIFRSMAAGRMKLLREMGIGLVTGHNNERSTVLVHRMGNRTVCTYTICTLEARATAAGG